MHISIKTYGQTMLLFLICSCLVSVVTSALFYFDFISLHLFHQLNFIFKLLAYFFCGVYFSCKQKKKVLKSALYFLFVITLVMTPIQLFNRNHIIRLLLNPILFLIGCCSGHMISIFKD